MEELIMKKTKNIFILILALSLLMTCLISVHASDSDKSVADYADEFCSNTKCSSVSIVVVRGDETEICRDADGLYQIGSMTKAFTGLGIQKLIRSGVIGEDDAVSKWIPGFVTYYDGEICDITVRQLLAHTSGFTNKESDYPSATNDMSLMEWTATISGKKVDSKPGTEYSYSNVNYNLLGAVIEQATGMSYKEYMETEILQPLGLMNTYVKLPSDDERIVQGSRPGYRLSFTYTIPVAPGQIPAGYFYSNASDMARWLQIWLGTADIPEEYRELVCSVKEDLINAGDYYSGWEVFENGTVGHSGGTPNYSSRIVFSDEEQTGVCVLTNMNVASSTDSLCNGIYAACTGQNFGGISTDVWTVFDIVFTAVTALGLMLIILAVTVRHRGVLTGTVCLQLILLISVCIVMPLVFGAGLDKIVFIWAPYSFAGGLIMLAGGVFATAIKLRIMKKNAD